jgi:thiosulfate/3-mercaptopyruvate sulfurtransferase
LFFLILLGNELSQFNYHAINGETMTGFAHPHMLVTTQWVENHLNNPKVRCIEVAWNSDEYNAGHIPGAIFWNWNTNVMQPGKRDIIDKSQLEEQFSQAGVTEDMTIILYDGYSNLLAVMTLWMLKIYGHLDARLLDGGRVKWISEKLPLSTKTLSIQASTYIAQEPDWTLRAHRDFILGGLDKPNRVVIDARPSTMYTGEDAMGGSVGGHIPNAINIPAIMEMENGQFRRWQTPTTNPDGTFKSFDELQALFAGFGISPDKEVITYCVRGGLSSHMWFVLKYLLGYPDVRQYDGSWVEWGNLIDVPITRGSA